MSTKTKAQAALRQAAGSDAVDDQGRFSTVEENLVPAAARNWEFIRKQLDGGDGGELKAKDGQRPKFASAWSSAALAVNAFSLFHDKGVETPVLGLHGPCVVFEQQHAPGPGAPRKANLDVELTAGDAVVAVESKCTEHLTRKRATFAAKYETWIDAADPGWRALYKAAQAVPDRFRLLDVAQLVKHHLGLRNELQGVDARLAYVFWEPSDNSVDPTFEAHRGEISDAMSVLEQHDGMALEPVSYPELWSAWELSGDAAMRAHVAELRARYDVGL